MATTNRIASDTLAVGEMSAAVTLSFSSERLVLDFTAAQVGTDDSLVRLVVRDSLGRVILTDSLFGSDTQRSSLESAQSAVAGSLTASIECLKGSATVQLDEITGTAAFGTGASGALVQTADLATGVLAASVAGRALMTTGYFTEAKALDAVAAGALVASLMKDDTFVAASFVAGAGGKFAPDCLDATAVANVVATGALTTANLMDAIPANALTGAACAQVFLNGAIPGAKLAAGPFSLDTPIADPGAGGAIAVVTSGTCEITTAGVEAYTLAAPTISGQVIKLEHVAGAFACTVTCDALDPQATLVLNFTAGLGQWIVLVGYNNGAALRWRVLAQGGTATNSVPVYVPLGLVNPAPAGNVTALGPKDTWTIVTGAGETRTLNNPLFDGQTVKVITDGANATTVTVTNGFTNAGALNIYLPAVANAYVVLVGRAVGGAFRWRVLEDPAGITQNVGVIAAAGAIPIVYDDGVCQLNIAAPADDRTLPDASYVGQRLTIVHSAGANAGTVTAASDINPLVGGQNVINFTAALAEMVVLQATSSLDWRLVTNPNALVLS
jgi:hypothetical protein